MNDEKELTLRDIMLWIMDHKKDTEAMDEISYATFPYTTKYKQHYGIRPVEEE